MATRAERNMELYNDLLAERRREKASFVLMIISYVVIIIWLLYYYRDHSFIWDDSPIYVLIIPFVVFSGSGAYSKRLASRAYKTLLVYSTLEKTFGALQFSPDLFLSPNQLQNAGLISFGDSFNGNDFLSGEYNGVYFEQSDVSTGPFKGRVMVFAFNKRFKRNLRVCEHGFPYKYAKKEQSKSIGDFHEIELENIEFNKSFSVYAQDDVEAFYILTPHLMERLQVLQRETKGKLLLCFYGNMLYIAINDRRDSFEPPLFGKIDIEKEGLSVYNEIKLITNFIDELKLEENIYKP